MSKTVLLIDGDQYLYRSCAATETEVRWDAENHVLSSNEVEAWDTVQQSLSKLFDHFGTPEHVMCFGAGENFRKQIDPSYKMNRAGSRKPLCFHAVKQRMLDFYKCKVVEGIEADDVMGLLATQPQRNLDRIIISQDKDMRSIPGKLWDGGKFHKITTEEADYFHMYQTLVGDTADGYKGCPGVGPKKAEALLQRTDKDNMPYTVPEWWSRVKSAYEKAELTEADALRQARLARILRWSDWDTVNKKPILWTPTQ